MSVVCPQCGGTDTREVRPGCRYCSSRRQAPFSAWVPPHVTGGPPAPTYIFCGAYFGTCARCHAKSRDLREGGDGRMLCSSCVEVTQREVQARAQEHAAQQQRRREEVLAQEERRRKEVLTLLYQPAKRDELVSLLVEAGKIADEPRHELFTRASRDAWVMLMASEQLPHVGFWAASLRWRKPLVGRPVVTERSRMRAWPATDGRWVDERGRLWAETELPSSAQARDARDGHGPFAFCFLVEDPFFELGDVGGSDDHTIRRCNSLTDGPHWELEGAVPLIETPARIQDFASAAQRGAPRLLSSEEAAARVRHDLS